MKKQLSIILALSIIYGCNTPISNNLNNKVSSVISNKIVNNKKSEIHGLVMFPKTMEEEKKLFKTKSLFFKSNRKRNKKDKQRFSIKAGINDISENSTVSFINIDSNATTEENRYKVIGSALASPDGVFDITFGTSNFNPELNKVYILEASKRIGTSGANIMTIRTFIRWNGSSWDSITSDSLIINEYTTAISIIQGFNSSTITKEDTFNKVSFANNVFTPTNMGSVGVEKIYKVANYVLLSIYQSKDPYTVIKFNNTDYYLEQKASFSEFIKTDKCEGCKFSQSDLQSFDFRNKDLAYADFSGLNLSNVDFTNSILYKSNLSNTSLQGNKFSSTDLTGSNISNSEIGNVLDMSGSDFTGVNFTNTNLSNIDFTSSIVENVILKGAHLISVNLSGSDLSNIDFTGTNFDLGYYSGSDFSGGIFTNSILSSSFIDCDFSFSNFNQTQIINSKFLLSDFNNTIFENVSLGTSSNFINANFETADFSNQNLSGVNLRGAILKNQDLSGKSLINSDFSNTDLTGVNLLGADITNSSFNNALLSGTTMVDGSISNYVPESAKIAFVSNKDGNNEIYVLNQDKTGLLRLTSNILEDSNPIVTQDNSKVVYVEKDELGKRDIYIINSNGTNNVKLTDDTRDNYDAVLSSDGTKIIYTSKDGVFSNIYVMNLDGTNKINITNQTDKINKEANVLGNKLVYVSNDEIYQRNLDGSNLLQLTSLLDYGICKSPKFSPNGTQVSFLSNTNKDNNNINNLYHIWLVDSENTNVSINGKRITGNSISSNYNYKTSNGVIDYLWSLDKNLIFSTYYGSTTNRSIYSVYTDYYSLRKISVALSSTTDFDLLGLIKNSDIDNYNIIGRMIGTIYYVSSKNGLRNLHFHDIDFGIEETLTLN